MRFELGYGREVLAAVVLAGGAMAGSAWAEAFDVDLNLAPPGAGVNLMDTTIRFSFGPAGNEDTQAVELSGNVLAQLEIDNAQTSPVITGLTLTGGTIFFSDTDFSLTGNVSPVPIPVSTQGLGGSPNTIAPPSSVAQPGGTFDLAEHELVLTQGQVQLTVPAAGQVTIDLASDEDPIAFSLAGQGTVTLAPAAQAVGSTVSVWDVTLDFPIDAAATIVDDPSGFDVTIEGAGRLLATTQLEIVVPEPTVLALAWAGGLPLVLSRRVRRGVVGC